MAIVMMATSPTTLWAISGNGTSKDDPLKISSASDWATFRSEISSYTYPYVELAGDINLSGTEYNLYNFKGHLDGKGFTIRGLNGNPLINQAQDAVIQNLNLEGSVSGSNVVASAVCTASGSTQILNVRSSVNITVTAPTITLTTIQYAGGIVGKAMDNTVVSGCSYSGTITSGSVSTMGRIYQGGIVGYAGANTGKSNSTTISNCWFSGKLVASEPTSTTNNTYIGGILGYVNEAFGGVSNCYHNGTLPTFSATKYSRYVAAIIGYCSSTDNVTNNHYLKGTATQITLGNIDPSNTEISISVTAGTGGSVAQEYVAPTSTTATMLQVTATPSSSDYVFSWSDGKEQTHTVDLTANVSLTASFTKKTGKAVLDGSTLTFYYDVATHSGTTYSLPAANVYYPGWYDNRKSITTVVFDASFASCRPVNCCNWFFGFSNLTTITGIANLNTEKVTNMAYMFSNCSKLTSLDVSNFNTAKVTGMGSMFDGCSQLTALDVSNFNTASVKNMNAMFYGCSQLTSLDVSNFNTAKVTDMGNMFRDCSQLAALDVSKFNTASVTDMTFMFYGCSQLTALDVSSFNTASVTNMTFMFSGCSQLTSLDVSNFNTAKVTTMNTMFSGCSQLTSLDVSNFNTASVKNMDFMFYGCSQLTALTIGNFDMQKVTYITSMFTNSSNLKTLTLKSVPFLKDGSFNKKFKGTGVTVKCLLDENSTIFSGTNYLPAITDCNHYFNTTTGATSPATCTEPKKTQHTCQACKQDYYVPEGEALGHTWSDDTHTYCTSCDHSFIYYTATSKVTPNDTESLPGYSDANNTFDSTTKEGVIELTSKLTSIGENAFQECTSLQTITIPSSVTSIGNYAFYDCENIQSITIPNGVTSIGDFAFEGCTNLQTVSIQSSVTTIGEFAFSDCKNLQSFNIPSSVTSIGDGAFDGCTSLKSITIPSSVTSIGDGAFDKCI